ncbi:hypothetical protein OIV83_000964 [Microbotryomycetes sp. JL201]|nr:hypothetical protein OIV83_000964 [Microbotryomycetes sp. JL201]
MAGEHAPVLPQGVGYAVVLGLGLSFAAFMLGLTWLQNRYSTYKTSSPSEFASASHSVKPGLIAAGIVSAWTWSATLLQSSAVAYRYGICGPWWYAAGAAVQILLFAQNAAKLKINAPGAHTFLEVIRTRWGKAGHMTFGFFSFGTNIIVSGMLLTGGSATVSDITNMSTPAACMLIPVGVVCYILLGGMRASLIADYLHTACLLCVILTFMFSVYATNDKISSPGAMWDLLKAAAIRDPVAGNAEGSRLTFRSNGGLVFGVLNIIGNFATVYLDQAYYQRAIASKPVTSVRAFMLGGSAWLAIPLGFATTMGLSAVALTTNPDFPGYPDALSKAQISAGLPAPAAAVALLGKTGAALMLVVLFLAITSAASAELIAVSSVVTYDIYLPYVNPAATEKQVLRCERVAIIVSGALMGVLGIVLYYASLSMGWLYEFMGTALGSAVTPTALCIMWSRANKYACIGGAWLGLASGLTAWLVTAKTEFGAINMDTTGENYSMLAGNLAAIGVGTIVSVIGSLMFPDHYDFVATRALHAEEHRTATNKPVIQTALESPLSLEKDESKDGTPVTDLKSAQASIADESLDENDDPILLGKAFKMAVRASVAAFVVLILCIPLPLFFSSHQFSKADFYVFVTVTFIWVFYSIFAVVVYPVYESRQALMHLASAVWTDVKGR